MRIGHTSIKHQYLIKMDDPPLLSIWAIRFISLTIKHIVTEYLIFESQRREVGIYNILSEPRMRDTIYF